MKTLEITLPDDVVSDIEEAARQRGVSVEELLRSSVVEKLERDSAFELAASRVVEKNTEL